MTVSEKPIEYYQKKGHYNPVEAKRLGVPLRVSKSSFMQYLWCPRQFWWSYVEMPDLRPPPTPEMERGSEIHDALDDFYDTWAGETVLRPVLPISGDPAYAAIAEMEEQRLEGWGEDYFGPVEHEVHHEVYNEELNIVMVGRFDAVYRHPDGGLVLGELKTGNMGANKLSKTRKELCFYKLMCDLMGWGDEFTHFLFMSPDCDNAAFVGDLLGKTRNKPSLILGDIQGITIVEPIASRSFTAMQKSLSNAVDGMRSFDWRMKWNDYTCPVWCDYHLSCEAELLGVN